MTRFGALFWLALVLATGFATFKVKYAVQDIEDQLHRVHKQTIADQQEIRVLTAEWTYLNQPERLADLNQRFLGLLPISAKQLQQKIADIPLRAPAAQPDIAVAVAAVASAPATLAAAPARAELPAAGDVAPATPATPAPTAATLASAPARADLPVQLAAARSDGAPQSLDALVAQIAAAR